MEAVGAMLYIPVNMLCAERRRGPGGTTKLAFHAGEDQGGKKGVRGGGAGGTKHLMVPVMVALREEAIGPAVIRSHGRVECATTLETHELVPPLGGRLACIMLHTPEEGGFVTRRRRQRGNETGQRWKAEVSAKLKVAAQVGVHSR